MNWLKRILKTFGARAVGIAAGVATAKIAEKTGIIVDPDSLTETALVLIGYAAGHRATSSKINPGDAASARVATAVDNAVATGTAVVPEQKR